MSRFKNWIDAFRLRTLFLALACVITGGLLPLKEEKFNYLIFAFTLLTTIFLQIVSNLANDYGDADKGTDNKDRIGPQRSIQSGKISADEMKRLIVIFILLAFFSGGFLLWISIPVEKLPLIFVFLLLGIGAIWAAVKYTIGKSAFGYRGLGDVFVFIFFGIVGVSGSYFLQSGKLTYSIIFPSVTMGLFSVGVLNLNNMRDIVNDRAYHKKTIPVRIGLSNAKVYHIILLVLGWISAIIFSAVQSKGVISWVYFLVFPLFFVHIVKVLRREGAQLDPLLKELSIITFLFSALFVVSHV